MQVARSAVQKSHKTVDTSSSHQTTEYVLHIRVTYTLPLPGKICALDKITKIFWNMTKNKMKGKTRQSLKFSK